MSDDLRQTYNPDEDESEYTEWTYNKAKHRYEYVPEFAEENKDA